MVRTSREPSPRRIRRWQHQAIRLHSERLPNLKLERTRAGSIQRKLEPSRKRPLLLKQLGRHSPHLVATSPAVPPHPPNPQLHLLRILLSAQPRCHLMRDIRLICARFRSPHAGLRLQPPRHPDPHPRRPPPRLQSPANRVALPHPLRLSPTTGISTVLLF